MPYSQRLATLLGAAAVIGFAVVAVDCVEPEPVDITVPAEQGPDLYASGGFFVDSPVEGLRYASGNLSGWTDEQGAFEYAPDRPVTFAIGSTVLGEVPAARWTTPIDLVAGGHLDDPAVLNIAWFLQSIDRDGQPRDHIEISEYTELAVDVARIWVGLDSIDWSDRVEVATVLRQVYVFHQGIDGHALKPVSPKDARANLLEGMLRNGQLRVTPSATPERPVHESTVLAAPGATISLYTQAMDIELGPRDVFASVSTDGGTSWARTNLSDTARLPVPDRPWDADLGDAEATVFVPGIIGDSSSLAAAQAGDRVLIAWADSYCPAMDPGGADANDDPNDVVGPQGSIDYGQEMGFDALGIAPFRCVWTVRGLIEDDAVRFSAPQQLTSGVRDAIAITVDAVEDVGFAMAWQEDPIGRRAGCQLDLDDCAAAAHKGTRVWYSSIAWDDFTTLAPSPDKDRPEPGVALEVPAPLSGVANTVAAVRPDLALLADGAVVAWEQSRVLAPQDDLEPGRATLPGEEVQIVLHDGCRGICVRLDDEGPEIVLDPRHQRADSVHRRQVAERLPPTQYMEPTPMAGSSIRFVAMGDFQAPGGEPAVLSRDGLHAREVRVAAQSAAQAGDGPRVAVAWREGGGPSHDVGDVMVRFARTSLDDFGATANISSPAVLGTDATTVTDWRWQEADLDARWDANMHDDARDHAIALHGAQLVATWAWTPDADAVRQEQAHYDAMVRSTHDGGQTWGDDQGRFRAPLNLTQWEEHDRNAGDLVLAVQPATAERAENPVVAIAFATRANPMPTPLDIRFTRSTNGGQTWEAIPVVDPYDGDVRHVVPWMARGDADQQAPAIALSADGERLVGTWQEEALAPDGIRDDVFLRAIDYRLWGAPIVTLAP